MRVFLSFSSVLLCRPFHHHSASANQTCYFIPTWLFLDYFTVNIRYQFCATSRIQFTIKTKIMLPFTQMFHVLLIVQEHVLLSPSYLGDIPPFQHLFPILPFTGKSQTRHWSTTYSTYVHMEFLYSHRDFCPQQKHKFLDLNIWSPGLGSGTWLHMLAKFILLDKSHAHNGAVWELPAGYRQSWAFDSIYLAGNPLFLELECSSWPWYVHKRLPALMIMFFFCITAFWYIPDLSNKKKKNQDKDNEAKLNTWCWQMKTWYVTNL